MHIAILYFGRRGAGGKISLELARELGRGQDVYVFLSGQVENLHEWQNVQAECVTVDTYNGAVGALKSLVIPHQIRDLARRIRQAAPDVLLFPMFHPWNSRIQKILADIPSLVFVHDPRPHPDLAGWFFGKLENESVRHATRCAVLSETLKPHLAERGVDSARIDIIPLGPFSYSMRASEKKNYPPTALFFGRIVPYKGIETLLEAFRRVRAALNCRLILAGDGNLSPYTNLLSGLPDVEVINHWIAEEEIGNLFMHADLVVLPYTSASQSGVIPIAAAFSLPVVATREGGLMEQVEDGVSGWLVDTGNADALAVAIFAALTSPEELRRRGLALKNRYETEFSWEQIASRVMKSLEMAAPARGPK